MFFGCWGSRTRTWQTGAHGIVCERLGSRTRRSKAQAGDSLRISPSGFGGQGGKSGFLLPKAGMNRFLVDSLIGNHQLEGFYSSLVPD